MLFGWEEMFCILKSEKEGKKESGGEKWKMVVKRAGQKGRF